MVLWQCLRVECSSRQCLAKVGPTTRDVAIKVWNTRIKEKIMKLQISLSAPAAAAPPITKGARVVAKVGREWFVGTITRAGAKPVILFDDGIKATITDQADLKDVKVISPKSKKMKKPLSAADAKALVAAGKVAAAPTGRTSTRTSARTPRGTKAAPAVPEKTGRTPRGSVKSAPAGTTDADIQDQYAAWIKKLSPAQRTAKAAKLKAQIVKMTAQGARAARRAEDAGPMDIMWERMDPIQAEVDLLEFAATNVNKPLPKDLLARFKTMHEHVVGKIDAKVAKQAAASKFPDIVGSTIDWKNPKTGKVVSTTVIKQFMSTRGAPKYKTKIEGSGGGTWTIPHSMVLKVTTPKNVDKVKAEVQKANAERLASKKEHTASVRTQNEDWIKGQKIAVGDRVRFMIVRRRRGSYLEGVITAIKAGKITVGTDMGGSYTVDALRVTPLLK